MTTLDWSKVVQDFHQMFQNVYEKQSRKAHIDNVCETDCLIDGAKNKWSPVLLIDGVLSLFYRNFYEKQKYDFKSKRKFDQVSHFSSDYHYLMFMY